MKKKIITILTLLVSALAFACSCDEIHPMIEFYSSEYVFEGKIISKVYSKDSLTYKVTFDISKHYKKGDAPKTLEFTVTSEGEITGIFDSCDWSAEKNQNWLVYARNLGGTLSFSGVCSNSKKITEYAPISLREQKILDHANSFKIENYIFENESGFNYCKNITDINTILESGKIKNYENQITLLNVSIDTDGKLKSVIRRKELIVKKDSIFDLITEIGDSNKKPITEFEKDAIELVTQVKIWEIKKHQLTGIKVPYIRHIWIFYDLDTNKWRYEL